MGRNLLMVCEELGINAQLVVHDRDKLLAQYAGECLDHLILVGLGSLQRVLVQYRRFY